MKQQELIKTDQIGKIKEKVSSTKLVVKEHEKLGYFGFASSHTQQMWFPEGMEIIDDKYLSQAVLQRSMGEGAKPAKSFPLIVNK